MRECNIYELVTEDTGRLRNLAVSLKEETPLLLINIDRLELI